MDYIALLQDVMEICVIPLLGVITAYLIKWINLKKEELKLTTDNEIAKKYMDMIASTITDCVIATNQTYVEKLKKEGKFTLEAQKKAFEETYNEVMKILSDEAKNYIIETFGDLQSYLTTKIEAEVNINK